MKKKYVIILCLLVLFWGFVNLFLLQAPDKLTEETTSKLNATVAYVREVCIDDETYLEINTNEFDAKLQVIPEVCTRIYTNNIESLQKNQKIFFEIETTYLEELETDSSIDLVSLSTEEEQIFTLREYNKYVSRSVNNAKSMVRSIVFAIAVYIIVLDSKRKSEK